MKTCPRCGKTYEDVNTLCPADGAVLRKEDTLVGSTLHEKYRIEEKLAEGGMGCVYRATHVLMEKTVAIKVLHPSLAADEKIVARFTREAKAASRISHPHALTVTDFGEDKNGVVFLVMEYLGGRTLKDIIRSEGQLSLPMATEIVRQVSGALEAAHAEGVVHRDLKSDNIMLEESDGSLWSKVLDFGIAKITEKEESQDPALTAPNLIIGTPQYMSPEQCSHASEIDSRSDIYSLGVILYEMLAGHVPFTGESPTGIMVKHLQEPPPSILEERSDLTQEVVAVIDKALAKRPEDRFQKASHLSDALVQAAANAPKTAPAPGDKKSLSVSTDENDVGRITAVDNDDEAETVVSGQLPPPVVAPPAKSRPEFLPAAQPLAQNFNPWKIAVPAIAILALIFVVVFAFQGTSKEEAAIEPSLIDPNSQPVQSLTPPSGSAETNIAPVAAVTPSPASTSVTPLPLSSNGNVEFITIPEEPVANTNRGRQQNDNTEPHPTPEDSAPANRNSNRREPAVNSNSDVPPPAPSPAQKATPAPNDNPLID